MKQLSRLTRSQKVLLSSIQKRGKVIYNKNMDILIAHRKVELIQEGNRKFVILRTQDSHSEIN